MELFVFHHSSIIFKGEDVLATYKDLVDLGLAKLPYAECAFQVDSTAEDFARAGLPSEDKGGERSTRFYYRNNNLIPHKAEFRGQSTGGVWKDIDLTGFMQDEAQAAIVHLNTALFLVILATKGIVKDRQKNKLASLGIGKDKRFRYITTLRPSVAYAPQQAGDGTRKAPRPHLRRGHIRNQRHGEGNAMVKRIWIEPCLVAGDAPDQRDHYEVKGE